jgi:hypothetical protein
LRPFEWLPSLLEERLPRLTGNRIEAEHKEARRAMATNGAELFPSNELSLNAKRKANTIGLAQPGI